MFGVNESKTAPHSEKCNLVFGVINAVVDRREGTCGHEYGIVGKLEHLDEYLVYLAGDRDEIRTWGNRFEGIEAFKIRGEKLVFDRP